MVYRNTKRSNYGSQKIKNSKGNRINNLESRSQIKNFNKRRYLNRPYSGINSIKKEFV